MDKIFPKKYLGQNFLINEHVKDRIIEDCNINRKDIILEIGPGLGALTEKIARKSDCIFAIETDLRLYRELQKNLECYLKSHPDKEIHLIHSDFLKYDLSSLPGNIKVIGNLPYNISSPIIKKLIDHRASFSCFFFTVQLEFAKRLAARPNTKDYSSLSCFAQYHCDVKILFKIKNSSFSPVPKVTSCFVSLALKEPLLKARDEDLLFRIIRSGFQQRRKKIINALSSVFEKDRLEGIFDQCRINKNLRAENLSLKNYVEMANCDLTLSNK